MRKYWESRSVRTGLALFVLGCGPLLFIIAAAAVGLWPDPNPNPIGPGILAFLTFWPSLICMVIGVIFVFLRNASATLIPSIALPISIVGTFSIMYVLDYSLDNLSMMALILSVGFVVDDAIVMLENIVRHLEKGETRPSPDGGRCSPA